MKKLDKSRFTNDQKRAMKILANMMDTRTFRLFFKKNPKTIEETLEIIKRDYWHYVLPSERFQ